MSRLVCMIVALRCNVTCCNGMPLRLSSAVPSPPLPSSPPLRSAPLHCAPQDGIVHALRLQRAAGAFEVGTNQSSAPSFWTVTKAEATDGSVEYRAKSDAEFERYLAAVRRAGCLVNDIALFSAHQTGSCPMGTTASNSAADCNGEVWEVSGLFLGDGSVFPTPVGVNPMVSIESVAFLLGQRLARRVAQGEFK